MMVFFVENQLGRQKRLCSYSFLYKKGLLSKHQSAISETPTVSSRLPSLMAAGKLSPLLQPSLIQAHTKLEQVSKYYFLIGYLDQFLRADMTKKVTSKQNTF